jgi:hypothetical protein
LARTDTQPRTKDDDDDEDDWEVKLGDGLAHLQSEEALQKRSPI